MLMNKILLSGRDICKSFPGERLQEMVLKHVDIDLYEGDFTVIMGSSGAGKSTLLYALSGMDKINSGNVTYRGTDITGMNEKGLAALRTEEFGFVFQQTHLVSNLTLLENVKVAGYLQKKRAAKETEKRAEELLAKMHVEHAKNRLPANTSGGEAQRAAIARAVINQPGILFADEPTGALNRGNTEGVLNLFTMLNQDGQSILMVTHDIRAAIRGNRILYLEDGSITEELKLPAFSQEEAKAREKRLSEWLTAMEW